MKKIDSVRSFSFEDSILVSLTKDWINHFNGIPEFEVFLDNKRRLHLVSKPHQEVSNDD